MTKNTQYETRRLELLKEVGDKIHAIEKDVEERESAILKAHHSAQEHGQFQRFNEARQEHLKVSQFQELNRHDAAKLRDLQLKQHEIGSGNHPELAGMFQVGVMRGNSEKHDEVAEARAAFEQLMTPELKAAAQRLIDAQETASPLLPVSHLAETIAKGV